MYLPIGFVPFTTKDFFFFLRQYRPTFQLTIWAITKGAVTFKKIALFKYASIKLKSTLDQSTTPIYRPSPSYFMCHCNFFLRKRNLFSNFSCVKLKPGYDKSSSDLFPLISDQSSIRDDSSTPVFFVSPFTSDSEVSQKRNFCCYWLTSSLWPSTKFFSAWIKEPKKKKV